MNKKETPEEKAKELSILVVHGEKHVIRPYLRNGQYPDPNYRGTGQALAGIMRHDETFEEFKERWIKGRKRINKGV